MTTAYTSLLGLALPVTGELSGTWGDTVNNYITQYVDSAVAGTQTISGSQTVVTLSVTTAVSLTQVGSGATGSAQYSVINCTGNPASTLVITAPAASKAYVVINATSTSQSVTLKASATTGVTLVSGEKAFVAWNGSDFVKIATSISGAGAITAVSVASSNGLAGTSSGGTTPTLTLSTTVNGIVKGNATSFSAATAGTDYLAPPSGTAILKANSGGALANATAGTDYVAPGAATTFTATQTFAGTSSNLSAVLSDAAEPVTVSATAATGTINFDTTTQSILYYTTSASANWVMNFRASSGTALNSLLSTGQAVTVVFLATNGATPYRVTSVQVDGTTAGVTTRWQGGAAPSVGNASSVDAYTFTIVKTGSATFSVFAAQTQFA